MNIHLGLPQMIYVAITTLGLLLSAIDHGRPRKPENVWISLAAVAITYALLIWGGFFR